MRPFHRSGRIVAGSSAYSQLLQDRRWQRKRLEIFQRDRWRCQADECPELGRNDIPLHVHHLRYLAGCLPWDYPDELLASYCQTCHDAYHGY